MFLFFAVSNSGCVLQMNEQTANAFRSAGVEIFESYEAAASRFTASDVGRQELLYFEAVDA